MDKRYAPLTPAQQLALRRQVMDDILGHPEWPLPEVVRHLKKGLRLTTAELATLSGVSFKTLQNIERETSPGTVQTLNRVLGVLGLRLGAVKSPPTGC